MMKTKIGEMAVYISYKLTIFELLLMGILDLLSPFDALCVHDAIFVHDEVVEGTSSIDPIRLLELFRVSEPVEKEEELRVLVGLVDRAS